MFKSASTAGIVLGVVYVICAVFAVPLEPFVLFAAPAVCGLLAAYSISGKVAVTPGTGAKLGALSGLVGGAVLVLVGAPLLNLILSGAVGGVVGERLRGVGFNLPDSRLSVLFVATLIEAARGTVMATLGGLNGAILFGRR